MESGRGESETPRELNYLEIRGAEAQAEIDDYNKKLGELAVMLQNLDREYKEIREQIEDEVEGILILRSKSMLRKEELGSYQIAGPSVEVTELPPAAEPEEKHS